jgi:hypothetical protein
MILIGADERKAKFQRYQIVKTELDRHDVSELLGVASIHYHKLRRNPTFPKPDRSDRFDRDEILRFKQIMDDCRNRVFKVPGCLY